MTGTWAVLIFIAGAVAGLCGRALIVSLSVLSSAARPVGLLPDTRPLPPATLRSLARAARRNRADLRRVLPARTAGVRFLDRRDYDLPRLLEPPPLTAFEQEDVDAE